MTANGAGRRRGIAAELEFARQKMLHAAIALDDHDQVNALDTDLQAPASTRDREEGWCAPASGCAARSQSTATFGAKYESALNHMRHHGDALGMIEHFFGDAFVRGGHDLAQNLGSLVDTLLNFTPGLICPANGREAQHCKGHHEFFHRVTPFLN